MLKNLFQSREDKIRARVEKHIAEGMNHLSRKFYNGAMIELNKAMELDPGGAYPRLTKELESSAASGDLESALAIGLNLIKENNGDYKLANKLGNYARELKDYKQANGLYKTALKMNKGFRTAFYNLAASQAKVDIFDDSIRSALAQFDDVKDYVLPDYLGDANIMEQFTTKIEEEKQLAMKDALQGFVLEKEQIMEAGKADEAQRIEIEINKLKETNIEVSFDDMRQMFRNKIEEDPPNAEIHRFNLGVYALANKKTDVALEAIDGLSADAFPTIELLQAIALEQRGNLNEAIDKLVRLLGKNEFNRYNNVNLGIMYRKAQKEFLSIKYLIKTAYLLNKSGGLYSMKELLRAANEAFEQGQLKKALNFFCIAATEIPDPDIWYKIGMIYIERKKNEEAVEAFRRSLGAL